MYKKMAALTYYTRQYLVSKNNLDSSLLSLVHHNPSRSN